MCKVCDMYDFDRRNKVVWCNRLCYEVFMLEENLMCFGLIKGFLRDKNICLLV